MKTYKIWDSLYKQSTWGIFEYTVFLINTLETKWKKTIFYNVQCQNCSDHEKCELALKINDYWKVEYSHMLNDSDEDSEKQYFWHCDWWKNQWKNFFDTRLECMIDTYERTKEFYIKENEEAQKKIDKNILKIKEIEEKVLILTNK